MRNGFANGICTTFVESYARIGTITVYTSSSHSTIIIEMTAWFAFTAGIARRIYLTNLTKWAICVTATTWEKISMKLNDIFFCKLCSCSYFLQWHLDGKDLFSRVKIVENIQINFLISISLQNLIILHSWKRKWYIYSRKVDKKFFSKNYLLNKLHLTL